LLPSLRPGHGKWVEAVDAALRGATLAIAGNFFAGMSLEECAARAAQEFAHLRSA